MLLIIFSTSLCIVMFTSLSSKLPAGRATSSATPGSLTSLILEGMLESAGVLCTIWATNSKPFYTMTPLACNYVSYMVIQISCCQTHSLSVCHIPT